MGAVRRTHTRKGVDIEFEVKQRNGMKAKKKTEHCVKSFERGHTIEYEHAYRRNSVVHSQPNEK